MLKLKNLKAIKRNTITKLCIPPVDAEALRDQMVQTGAALNSQRHTPTARPPLGCVACVPSPLTRQSHINRRLLQLCSTLQPSRSKSKYLT